ncbi:hypothetical protein BDK88_2095 [Natrinema hispanicum]|uniref:Uncharacterized protein n=1 Tax=Natrinema hispanicum TaxID=392421 RepID=A0A482YDM4_9EURY|nr:hypothetical protein BDK88_2095 [Natrinema hispanicum]
MSYSKLSKTTMFIILTIAGFTRDMSKTDLEDEVDREHLDDIEDGAGCVEIWEKLSDQRSDD